MIKFLVLMGLWGITAFIIVLAMCKAASKALPPMESQFDPVAREL